MESPRATYRLQFSREFGFSQAANIAPFLAALGISHVYASPYLKARPGSTHGYDIVAHDALNPELGDDAAFRSMHEAFVQHGLKQILDFVPNHMGVGGADNPLWLEVLEWGPLSPYAGWFDIDWEPSNRYLTEKLLVPVLGDQYGKALEDGNLQLKFDVDAGEFAVWAYDTHKLPICPLQYASILGNQDADLERMGDEFASLLEWRPQLERRADELKAELSRRVSKSDSARTQLTQTLARLNGAEDSERCELDALSQQQYWRASHFRVAGDDINYRRFFNVNELAGLRMELPDVFEHAHKLVFQLLREGVLDGLRIDHIDGLLDPKAYLERLRGAALLSNGVQRPFYLVVEKILAKEESLPPDWPVEGTTGYEFANLVAHLLLNASGEATLTWVYQEFTDERRAFAEIVRDCKIRIMKNEMASELSMLARDAARVARQNARTADFTRNILRRAIRELVACLPVYRTYLDDEGSLPTAERESLRRALETARANERDVDPSVFDFLQALLTGELVSEPRSGFSRHSVVRCAMKLQQYSGPVMAKGLEDTAFYRFNRLIALNEVGGFPNHFGISVAQFHAANAERAKKWPANLLTTATHDTKRGEDARARLLVLADIPEEWAKAVNLWRSALRDSGVSLNDPNTEYFFYQLLIGSWPNHTDELNTFRERVKNAMRKSVREAKGKTTWATPNVAYENRLIEFIDAALDTPAFLSAFVPFQQRVAHQGVAKSLVQLGLKLTAPGIPDVYQGTELWDLSLVDPDNRRVVDFDVRARMLSSLQREWADAPEATIRKYLTRWQDGGIKLLLTSLLLRLRASYPGLFAAGGYRSAELPEAEGDHLCAFFRTDSAHELLVVARLWPKAHEPTARPNALLRLPDSAGTAQWRHIFYNSFVGDAGSTDVNLLLADLPIAVLIRAL